MNPDRIQPTSRARSIAPLLAALAVVAVADARAQGGARPAERTSAEGVYSDEQARAGRDLYSAACQGCHTAASHTGETFAKSWDGKTLAELFAYVSARMPKNDPGSLAPLEYAQLVAYLLKMNGMPAGKSEMPADSAALTGIRIETSIHPGKR